MIDINELKVALEQIEQEKKDEQIALQAQLKVESNDRRVTAIDYITTLDLELKTKTTAGKKTECYILMDYLRTEQKIATYWELREELQKKIDELLILANQYKDLQRVGNG